MATVERRHISLHRLRGELSARLVARREEIEQAARDRICAVADPSDVSDPQYAEGLRAAVSAALDYGLASVERSEERSPSLPVALLAQARLAGRSGVSLDTVLRRCFAGYTLLGDFLMAEAEQGGLLGDQALQKVLRAQAARFDRLIAAVTEEYGREAGGPVKTAEERRAQRVKRLLAGDLLDTSDLRYDFEAHHLGLIAVGPNATGAIHDLADALDRSLLWVRDEESTVWAWLGGRREIDAEKLERVLSTTCPSDLRLALGERGEGVQGWRLSHRQAKATLPIALRRPHPFTRYADVALLASALKDDLLVTSLRQLYLRPFEEERDGGEAARATLRAYFAAGRNASSAAAALGISRQAVHSRLQTIEGTLGRRLERCIAELEAALRVEGLDPAQPSPRKPSTDASAGPDA